MSIEDKQITETIKIIECDKCNGLIGRTHAGWSRGVGIVSTQVGGDYRLVEPALSEAHICANCIAALIPKT